MESGIKAVQTFLIQCSRFNRTGGILEQPHLNNPGHRRGRCARFRKRKLDSSADARHYAARYSLEKKTPKKTAKSPPEMKASRQLGSSDLLRESLAETRPEDLQIDE